MSEAAVELRAHGHHEASDAVAARSVRWYEAHPSIAAEECWFFANSLWMLDRRHDLESFVVQINDAQPGDSELAGWLGVTAAADGHTNRAMEISKSLPVSSDFRDPGWKNWQAAIAAHLGDKNGAVELLAEGFSKGRIYDLHLHSSLLFEPLWDYPPFQKLIEPKG